MKNYVIINGVNSNTITGLMINELPPISKPEMRVQREEIDGRDGDITTNLGYSAYDKTITIGLFGTGYDINDIISFFNGEGTIVFSNEDDKYYKYKVINQIDYEALQKFKQATITFHCQPFKYPLEETPLEIEYEYIEQEGVESATMNNTNGGTSLKIDLKGNTSQDTTTGKNLIPIYDGNKTIGSLSYTIQDGIFKLNGNTGSSITSNYFDSFQTNSGSAVFWVEATGYTDKESANASMIIQQSDDNTNWSTFSEITLRSTTPKQNSITLNSSKYYRLRFYTTDNTFTNATIKVMLEYGTSKTDWEKYTNGASPNPSYPQQIHEVSGDNEVVVCGRNLTDESVLNQYKVSEDDEAYIFGNNNLYNKNLTPNIKFKENTQYTIQYIAKQTTGNPRLTIKYTDGTVGDIPSNSSIATTYTKYERTSNALKTIDYITSSYGSYASNGFLIKKNSFCIVEGEDTTYYPYNGDTYELDLGVENLLNSVSSYTFSSNTNEKKDLGTINLVAGTTYYYTYYVDTATTSSTRNTPYIKLSGTYTYESASENYNKTTGRKEWYFTPSTSGTYDIGYWVHTADVDTTISKFMVSTERGSYTPYGIEPIKMRGIGTYEDYFVRNSGKNLLNLPNGTYTHGSYSTTIKNGIVIPNFTSVSQSTITPNIPLHFTFKAGITYTFNNYTNQNYPYFNFKNGDTIVLAIQYGDLGKKTFVFNEDTTIDNFQIYYGSTSQNYGVMKPQLEKGETSTDFEPYGTGQWCKYNAIGEYVFTGSENWTYYRDIAGSNLFRMPFANYTKNVTCYSNNYKGIAGTSGRTNFNIYLLESANSSNLDILDNRFTSVSDFNIWLSTHNTEVQYVLATPYLSLIEDDTLISQLDNIQNALSYEGQTNVSQTNNDKPFLLDLIAMEKGTDEVVINNIGNVYAKPTIALEGTGETDIYLNNTEILKVDLSEKNKITIDTNNMEAYVPTDNSLANRKVIGNYNSMTLPSGNTTMKITGALTKATITDYTRWL